MLWDDNKVQIDGSTDLAFTEDVLKRYEAYGWQTLSVSDGDSSLESIDAQIERAKADASRPTLIKVTTTIGYGAAKEGTAAVHGVPLGIADLEKVKAKFGFGKADFAVPEDVSAHYRACGAAGAAKHAAWRAQFGAYAHEYPELAADFSRRLEGKLPAGWREALPSWTPADKELATRKASNLVLNKLCQALPEMVGGSADLTPSNLTKFQGALDFQASTPEGRYVRFGVREHAMAAICNGMHAFGMLRPFCADLSLSDVHSMYAYIMFGLDLYIGMLRPFCATFLNFIGYAAGAVRVSALSHHAVIYIATHDSIGLGEDGPTHQPVEMLTMLRDIYLMSSTYICVNFTIFI